MTATLRLPTAASHLHGSLSRKVRVARDLHVSVAMADKYLYGEAALNTRYADVIESDLRAGDLDAVASWTAPADAALMGSEIPRFMDALCDYDEADASEDVVQAELRHKPVDQLTDAELEAYGRVLAKELYSGTRTLAALRREQRDRRTR